MSQAQQTHLNIQLSEKLATYIVANPVVLKKYSGYSYVVFSKQNDQLNSLNRKLIKELLAEGKKVVTAQETKDTKSPWIFTSIYN